MRPYPLQPAFLLICLTIMIAAAWPALAGLAASGPPPRQDIQVKPVNEKSLRQALEKLKGKVVVVNFWATWCDPCREEFPALVALYHKYQKQGLEVLSVSVDDTDSIKQVKKFLVEQKVPFATFIKRAGNDEAFINSVNPDWSGAVPATFIYDRQGKLVHTIIGERKLADFEKAVLPLF